MGNPQPSPPLSKSPSLQLPGAELPPPYSDGRGTVYSQWLSVDPRSSSTQSLAPSEPDREGPFRRTLLLIYIHGFMGNSSSFKSLPAHIHYYLKGALSDSHVIHSKVYPRYKTYKSISVARDNFSAWLRPHESPTTDVILIGHSMGGILAGDIVLLPNQYPQGSYPFQHRIIGSVSLDAPFLGLHPGVIVSGIASLFQKSPKPPGNNSDAVDSTLTLGTDGSLRPDPSIYSEVSPPSGATSPTMMPLPPPVAEPGAVAAADPLFNPPFFNDTLFEDRGWFRNIVHFAQKHQSENLVDAAANHIMSHLEFGGCLADYASLNIRHNKLRKLDNVDSFNTGEGDPEKGNARVRFVNYYTISTGVIKKPPPQRSDSHLRPGVTSGPASQRSSTDGGSRSSTPRISIEDHSRVGSPEVLQLLEPRPESDDEEVVGTTQEVDPATPAETTNDEPPTASLSSVTSPEEDPLQTAISQLPSIPELPDPPPTIDFTQFTDKEERKQAEKEAKRAQKAYDQALRHRDKALKERQKLVEKRRRQSMKDAERARKDSAKAEKEAQKTAERQEREEQKRLQQEEQALVREMEQLQKLRLQEGKGVEKETDEKKKKERKFCMLPGKVNGVRDRTWVGVEMEGFDEVGAHCGLFLPGPHYDKLIGDVGSRIVEWVHEDASRRLALELSNLDG